MLALIDADIVLYRVGHTTNNDEEWVAAARTDEMMDGILANTKASQFQLWLSGPLEENFRFRIWPEYKANRKDQVKPVHYNFIKEHLVVNWGARFTFGEEADDRLGIEQTRLEEIITEEHPSVICSIDKDLMQIPGMHYNFVKNDWQHITKERGLKNFYEQILVGDTTDNISGARGIGEAKSRKALESSISERELLEAVIACYATAKAHRDESPEQLYKRIDLAGKLLKIRQQEEEIWDFPELSQMVESIVLSTRQAQKALKQSTEPTTQPVKDGSPVDGSKTEAT